MFDSANGNLQTIIGGNMLEVWKDIINYEGKYQISNTGKVRSLNYNNTHTIKELKPKVNRFGFLEVKLSKNNKTKTFMVARLVGEYFIPNPMFKEEVIHISKDKTDNSVMNLKWAYHSESKHHMYNKGCRKVGKPTKTKITYKGNNYNTYSKIAKDNGIKLSTFYQRLYIYNWSLYEALETPIGRRY